MALLFVYVAGRLLTKKTKTAKYAFLAVILAVACFSALRVSTTYGLQPRDPNYFEHQLRPLEPSIGEVFSYINSKSIEGRTFIALDREVYFLIPVYTKNYIYVGNTFSSYLNSTENLELQSKMMFFYNYSAEETEMYLNTLFKEDVEQEIFFHMAYQYSPYCQPCDECTFEGEKVNLGWFNKGFRGVPDQHKERYMEIFNREYSFEEYDFDYIIINKNKNQEVRWTDKLEKVYENKKYSILEIKSSERH
jgi:hypothetical protein